MITLPLFILACSHERRASTEASPTAPPSAPVIRAPQTKSPTANSQNVTVSGELAASCKLHLESPRAPRVAYDGAALLPADRALLEELAECVTTGVMAGRKLRLIGRSDPRGTDEHDLGLGEYRAKIVGDFLSRLGVPRSQLAETSQAEIGARGAKDGSWRSDRRVDISLAN